MMARAISVRIVSPSIACNDNASRLSRLHVSTNKSELLHDNHRIRWQVNATREGPLAKRTRSKRAWAV
jgi:hypothetical protein